LLRGEPLARVAFSSFAFKITLLRGGFFASSRCIDPQPLVSQALILETAHILHTSLT
jgi:hypothetical protein